MLKGRGGVQNPTFAAFSGFYQTVISKRPNAATVRADYPAEVRKWKFSSVFRGLRSKGVVKFVREILQWSAFSAPRSSKPPVWVVRREISTVSKNDRKWSTKLRRSEKMVDSKGSRFFHGLVPFFDEFTADFSTVCKGHPKSGDSEKKHLRYQEFRSWGFRKRLVFHGLPPLDSDKIRLTSENGSEKWKISCKFRLCCRIIRNWQL